jgi:putative DNA primase/helicase
MTTTPEWERLFGSGPPAGAPVPPAAAAPPIDWADIDGPPPANGNKPPTPPGRPFETTDESNARRLVETHLHDLRYCPQQRLWLTWDGHRWRWDYAQQVVEHARLIADQLPRGGEWGKWRTKSLMLPRLSAMIILARSDERVVAHAQDLDRRPYELNTPTGVIDLRTAQLGPPDPAALHTRSTAVAPDLQTPPQRWLQFLATTFAGQPELTTYIQRLLGVSLVGQIIEQVFPVLHGQGRNGKGVLLDVVQAILGMGDEGYAAQAPTELIIATRNQQHPTLLARLSGVRFAITSEVDQGQRLAEARLKELTGGDTISARFMNKDFFDFRPTASLWLRTNHQPRVSSGGYALWQRMRLIPFAHIVPPAERDKHLAEKLVAAEGPAILGWLVAGARDYFEHGLDDPTVVIDATREYERDQDTVARFVDTCCQLGDPDQQHMTVQSSKLYGHYTKWCADEGEQAVSHKAFTGALATKYEVFSIRGHGYNVYRGIRFDDLDQAPDPDDPGPAEPPEPEQLPWPGYPQTPDPEPEEKWWDR